MPGGRPPKPTALKQLAGNPGKRKLNKAEPQPKAKRPPRPQQLQGEARKEWNRISKKLLELGLLTEVDRSALTAYCVAWASFLEASAKLEEAGMVTVTESGYPVISPYWTVMQQSAKLLKSYLTEFGLSPSSRSRLSTGSDRQPVTVAELLTAALDGEE